MTRLTGLGRLTAGRRDSRIDSEEGGRYLSIPKNGTFSRLTNVQGTGCGTTESCVGTVVAPTGFERLWTVDFRGVVP
jgi:hypothetical protein